MIRIALKWIKKSIEGLFPLINTLSYNKAKPENLTNKAGKFQANLI